MLIRDAEIAFKRDLTGWAMRATGNIALAGPRRPQHRRPRPVPGEHLAEHHVHHAAVGTSPNVMAAGDVAPGMFNFQAANVGHPRPATSVTPRWRRCGSPASPTAPSTSRCGTRPCWSPWTAPTWSAWPGFGAFSISPLTGFQLNAFRVTDFAIFPSDAAGGADAGGPAGDRQRRPGDPAARRGRPRSRPELGHRHLHHHRRRDPRNVRSLDGPAELELTVSGVSGTYTVGSHPTEVIDKPNTWTYNFTGPAIPETAIVTVKFLAGGVTASYGSGLTAMLVAEEERFYVFTPSLAQPKPGPVATLVVTNVSQQQLNAQGYIDVTYTSLPAPNSTDPAPPILKSHDRGHPRARSRSPGRSATWRWIPRPVPRS